MGPALPRLSCILSRYLGWNRKFTALDSRSAASPGVVPRLGTNQYRHWLVTPSPWHGTSFPSVSVALGVYLIPSTYVPRGTSPAGSNVIVTSALPFENTVATFAVFLTHTPFWTR